MAVLNPILLWPVRFTASTYDLEVTVNAVKETLTFPATGSLTAGRNYWMVGDDAGDADGGEGGVGDLLAMLESCLESHSQAPAVDVDFDASLLIKVYMDTTFTIHWNDGNTELAYYLWGAQNAALAGSSDGGGYSVTFGRRPYGYWRPRQPWSEDSRDRTDISTGTSTALDGTVYRTRLVDRKKERKIGWTVLEKERVLEEYGDDTVSGAGYSTDQTDTFEYMWRNAITYGMPVRIYEDETDLTLAYSLYLCDDQDEQWQRSAQYRLRWDVPMSLRRIDGSSSTTSPGPYLNFLTTPLPYSELNGTRAPTASDNASRGYSYGSIWVYGALVYMYTTAGWIQINAGGSQFSKLDTTHSPEALYLFEGNINDSSGNSHTLTDTITTEYVYTPEGLLGVSFGNNKTHILSTADSAGLHPPVSGDWTLQFILRSYWRYGGTGTTEVMCQLNKGTSGSSDLFISLDYPKASAGFSAFMSSASTVSTTRFAFPNVTTHYCVTYDGASKTLDFYMNGQSVHSGTTGAFPTGTVAGLWFGGSRVGSPQNWNGILCCAKYNKSKLSAAQVLAEAQLTGFAP